MICYYNLDKTSRSKKLQKKKSIPSLLKREILEALQKPGSVLATISNIGCISYFLQAVLVGGRASEEVVSDL